MSLASQAIQEVEATVADLVKAHQDKVAALKKQTEEQLANARDKSRASIDSYQSEQTTILENTIAASRNQADEESEQAIAELRAKITQKEPELVAMLLEEVRTRYGSL